MEYNIIDEKWIPVADMDGNILKVGTREALVHAHLYKEIVSANPLTEFSLYRFLNVFLMDAFRPEESDDLVTLYEVGEFSPERIDAYIEACGKDSFDLYHPEHPFMQVRDVPVESERKAVNYLDQTLSQGNNAPHYDHRREGGVYFAPDSVLPAILTTQIFAASGGVGYSPSINGTPPYYAMIKGQNLFETLCYMMEPLENITNFDDPPVFWRGNAMIPAKKEINNTSWLYGMLFPVRRIRVIPEDDGRVFSVYFEPGLKPRISFWVDPAVTYLKVKDGVKAWTPDDKKPIWNNIYALIDLKNKAAPRTIRQYMDLSDDQEGLIHVVLYGAQADKAKFIQLAYHDLKIPKNIVHDPERADCLRECVSRAEDAKAQLLKFFSSGKMSDRLKEDIKPYVPSVIEEFSKQCEQLFWNYLSARFGAACFDRTEVIYQWMKDIQAFVVQAVTRMEEELVIRPEEMKEFYQTQYDFFRKMRRYSK